MWWILVLFIIISAGFTLWNIINFCVPKPFGYKVASVLTVLIGGVLYCLCHCIFDLKGDYYTAIYDFELHYPLYSKYAWFVVVLLILGFAGFMILLFNDSGKLPPLVSVLSVSALILMNVFQILYAVQIFKHYDIFSLFLYAYHFNILLLSAFVIRKNIRQQIKSFGKDEIDFDAHRKFSWFYSKMKNISGYGIFIFLAAFIIFVFMGEGIDAPVRLFTDTADWTFSKQIPPPPLEYNGHYLCTVAAAGHKKIVKPLRFGTRCGQKIVVNRQLCVANAFEEVIAEKFPPFHRKIRHFYNTHGYPLSKKITTPVRVDVIYFMMKPLEWIFLLFLYAVDVHPEKRIARQYELK